MSVVQYIKQQLSVKSTPFVKDWQNLSESDKKELKEYAEAEMKILGIAIK